MTVIIGHEARSHSRYMGWDLYRCYDGGKPRMLYFAVKDDGSDVIVLRSGNLMGIKNEVRKAEGKE